MSRKKDILRRISEDLFAKAQLELIDEYFAEEYVNHDPPEGFSGDRDGLREFVQTIHNATTDIEAEATHVVVEGDLAASRWTVSAVHTGELFGVPPTHNTVNVSGIAIARFEDGKIVEEWAEQDNLGMLQQMGAIPETA